MSRVCSSCGGVGSVCKPAGPFPPLTQVTLECIVCDGSGLNPDYEERRKPSNAKLRDAYGAFLLAEQRLVETCRKVKEAVRDLN